MRIVEHTSGSFSLKGPSSGSGPYDDGGDYAICIQIEDEEVIIGEAFRRVGEFDYMPALGNAILWSNAANLLTACKITLPLLERFFEELKVAELDEVGRCPACGPEDYCSNHKLQHDLLNVIPSITRDIAKAEGTPPACADCGSVFQDGEPQRQGDGGQELCDECYGREYGERDAADAVWVRGDAEYDRKRGN